MPIKIHVELWQLLVYSFYGVSWAPWGGSLLMLGLKIGRNRGHQEAPEVYKAEWRQEQHKRLVAEERADTAEKVSKRFEIAMLQLAEAKSEEPARLRVARG